MRRWVIMFMPLVVQAVCRMRNDRNRATVLGRKTRT
jgi:hypothetical protein